MMYLMIPAEIDHSRHQTFLIKFLLHLLLQMMMSYLNQGLVLIIIRLVHLPARSLRRFLHADYSQRVP